jgi:hypothetical protein
MTMALAGSDAAVQQVLLGQTADAVLSQLQSIETARQAVPVNIERIIFTFRTPLLGSEKEMTALEDQVRQSAGKMIDGFGIHRSYTVVDGMRLFRATVTFPPLTR